MEKLLFVLMMVATFIACEGPTGPQGPPGRDGEPGEETRWIIKKYTIHPQDWEIVNGPDGYNSYFKYTFSESDLDDFIVNSGVLIGYYLDGDEWTPLLSAFPFEEETSNGAQWSEYYTYSYRIGKITFYLNYTDFMTSNVPTTDKIFRIVMQY